MQYSSTQGGTPAAKTTVSAEDTSHNASNSPAITVVRHLVAQRFKDLTPLLGRMAAALQGSRDFH
jgi:error-prone DNA polymerase